MQAPEFACYPLKPLVHAIIIILFSQADGNYVYCNNLLFQTINDTIVITGGPDRTKSRETPAERLSSVRFACETLDTLINLFQGGSIADGLQIVTGSAGENDLILEVHSANSRFTSSHS